MVAAVRNNQSRSLRSVARQFRTSLSVVQRWVDWAADRPLETVDWSGRQAGCRHSAKRTNHQVEELVLEIRKCLREESALGEYGAEAIHREMAARGLKDIPSVRTLGRILERCGVLDGRRRRRYQAPPSGWYLPEVAAGFAEMDSFDIVEDLVIRGGQNVNVLTGISLHGGLCAAWPQAQITAKFTVEALISHWRKYGLPRYAKFDNDTVFQGAHQFTDSFGRVMRLCLSLQVTPVFAPPGRHGFQNEIESFNGRWQEKVWDRFQFAKRSDVVTQSQSYVTAYHGRHAERIAGAPPRRAFAKRWKLDLQAPLQGRVIYIRYTNEQGDATLLGRTLLASPVWSQRLVRAEVDLTQSEIRFYALRRRDPHNHPLLSTHEYHAPKKPFSG
jgi:hypothetical protein